MSAQFEALIFLAEGFEEIEAITPIDLLRRAGIKVTSVGLDRGQITAAQGTRHLADITFQELPSDIQPAIIILPGGNLGTENLFQSEKLKSLLYRQIQDGRWVAAICAAPTILARHGLLRADTLITCYPSTSHWVPAAHYSPTKRVVVSPPFITSQGPGTSMEWSLEIIRQLRGQATAEEIQRGVIAQICA
ncbi:MAG: DJ-1/PfpI family protein [Methylacidiphilales bacterium]|nr:DJ-1/PfpI family protein [Candidatus Methylacidiphilales bacterium]MDW8348932.1 DJ-1/PfpI family protein [Verrucomicrobiae bacterium]